MTKQSDYDQLDLEIKELIDNTLPEYTDDHPIQERRKHAMTRDDVHLMCAIMKVIVRNMGCSAGFTEKEVTHVKFMCKWWFRIMAGLGTIVTIVLGSAFWALFQKIYVLWHKQSTNGG